MMNGLSAPKRLPQMKTFRLCTVCDRRRNLQDIASEMSTGFSAVQSILTDILGMSEVSSRWVPRMLTENQKRSRLYISRYSRYGDDREEFMDRVVTQDETWVHQLDPESKKQSMQWNHPGSFPPQRLTRVS